jgi:hypothetical protein
VRRSLMGQSTSDGRCIDAKSSTELAHHEIQCLSKKVKEEKRHYCMEAVIEEKQPEKVKIR